MALRFGRCLLETIRGHKRDRDPISNLSFSSYLRRFLSAARKKCSLGFSGFGLPSISQIFSASTNHTCDLRKMAIPDCEPVLDNGVCDFPCTCEEEGRIVTELISEAEANLKEGNLYFVISNRWYTSWQRYVGLLTVESPSGEPSEVTRPGPIDNHDIIDNESDDSEPQLRKMLEEGVEYVLVPQEVWRRLVEWYKGGPPIPRKMICQGFYSKSYSVEVYPLCLKLTDIRDESSTIITLSKQASVNQLYEMVCTLRGVAKDKARIWDYFGKKKNELLDPSSDKSLEESSLQIDQDILLEVDVSASSQSGISPPGNELTLVPVKPVKSDILAGVTLLNGHAKGSKSGLFQRNTYEDDGCDSSSGLGKGETRGLAGLQNLGNTCFMNSTLQCLAHTPPIVEYFLQNYSDDLNTENPLGMFGELAVEFGELLRKLWSSGHNSVAPRSFKAKLARFAPQFSGYNQHDSQEMLAFLLDGLHEDLNKVKRKPYIEVKDYDSRPDNEVAEELWNYHKARNDSVIVNVCQGQYKSTLVCPVCRRISITFDPFMYLSLPLPSTLTRSMTVAVFYADGSRLPMPYTVTVPKHGTCKDLSNALWTACCLNKDESLLLAEVYDNKIFRYFDNPMESLTAIRDDERLVAYRFNQMHKGTGKAKLEILHGEQEKSALDGVKGGNTNLFGAPLVTYINREPPLSGANIDAIISQLLSPLHRVHMSSFVHNAKENGNLVDATDETSLSLLSKDTEIKDETPDREMSFSLFLTDDCCTNFKPLQSASVVNPANITRVVVRWNEDTHKKYDSSYLNDLPEVYKTSLSAKKTKQESISLFSCLEAFLAEEPLGPDDMWYCPGCKEHKQANKKLDLWKLPDILVFHLKRFTYSRYVKNKLDTFVNFPIHNLDLSKYVKNKDGQTHRYELYAVSNHYGGLGGGHYTAYAKLIDDDKWYHFDDSHVSPVNTSDIKTEAAYVLFYKRVIGESRDIEY